MARHMVLLRVWVCWLLALLGQLYKDPSAISATVTMTSFPETKDGNCVFPFYYKNGIYYDCVKFQAKGKWCSLNKTFIGYWKYCLKDDFAKCAFPFWFRRLIYWECTEDGNLFGRKWCSLTKNFNRDQIWKYCDSY